MTGFLMRSTASNWAKGSILALDAGTHLSAIARILQYDFPVSASGKKITSTAEPRGKNDTHKSSAKGSDVGEVNGRRSVTPSPLLQPSVKLDSGPFAGLPFPHASYDANAVYIVREHVSTYLITHPHLDHLSGFAINTAAFHNTSRPKRLAALPSTVSAIKTHIFNDIIWPNLSDEDGGVGFVTFQRLTEGGNIALGEGHGRGYIEVCNGLGVKGFRVSHGHSLQTPPHLLHGHRNSNMNMNDASTPVTGSLHRQSSFPTSIIDARRKSIGDSRSDTQNLSARGGGSVSQHGDYDHSNYTVDSSAYFIRDEASGKEVLFFGDVEPDSISLTPRTHHVWAEAAPKVAAGILAAVFIECSYTDSQGDAILFGHLAPRHLIAELSELSKLVQQEFWLQQADTTHNRTNNRSHYDDNESAIIITPTTAVPPTSIPSAKKRKRTQGRVNTPTPPNSTRDKTPLPPGRARSSSRRRGRSSARKSANNANDNTEDSIHDADNDADVRTKRNSNGIISETSGASTINGDGVSSGINTNTVNTGSNNNSFSDPLKGLRVIVTHIKDTMADGVDDAGTIQEQLLAHEAALRKEGKGLGCTFEISVASGSYWF